MPAGSKGKKNIIVTPQQSEIISGREGIKRVIACAGSGKTFVLTSSISGILKRKLCRPDEILAITFTKNAAENMRKKIKERVGQRIDFNSIDIFTFNSFGNHIISENTFLLGLGKGYNLINIPRSWQILYEIVRKADFLSIKTGKDRGSFVDDILRYIWDLKNNLVTPGQLKQYIRTSGSLLAGYKSKALYDEELEVLSYQEDLCNVYERYEDAKITNNLVDYHDHVFLPYKLFTEKPQVRKQYSKKYKYIFIDEFQDTDVAQGRLIAMLYSPGRNSMMIVGDDDQGIYSFRGACVENILGFDKWDEFAGEEVKDYYLTTNFRSGDKIVCAIENIINANTSRFAKQFRTEYEGKQSEVMFFEAGSLKEEAAIIAKEIIRLKNSGLCAKDIAILSRIKKFRHITDALDDFNIKYELISSRGFYYEPEVLFIISWLMVIYDCSNALHIINILQSPKYKISDRDIFFLRNFDNDNNCFLPDSRPASISLINQAAACKSNPYLTEEAKERLHLFIDELKYYKSRAMLLKLGELIGLVYQYSGMADEFRSSFDSSVKTRIKNIEALIKLGADFAAQDVHGNLDSFIDYLRDSAKTEEEEPENAGYSNSKSVKVMSIHASKGLEFEAVFLPMLWNSSFYARRSGKKFKMPASLRKDRAIYALKQEFGSRQKFEEEEKRANLEEERRIFYVGCSRAKKYLYLSYSLYEEDIDESPKDNKQKEPLIFLQEVFKTGGINNVFLNSLAGGEKTEKVKYNLSNESIRKSEKLLASNIESLEIDILKKDNTYSGYIDALEKLKLSDYGARSGRNTGEKKFFSMTEVIDYIKCPQRYMWKYIYNIAEPPSAAADIGEKIHKYILLLTLERFGMRVKGNYTVSAKKQQEVAAWAIIPADEDPMVKQCVENYMKSDFFKEMQSDEMVLEQLFYWNLSGYVLNCKIDRLELSGKSAIRIIDYKSSGSQSDSGQNDYENQLKAYTSGISSLYKTDCSKIRCCLFYLKDGAIKDYEFKKEDLSLFDSLITDSIRKINAGDFSKIKGTGKKCCSFCSYSGLCK